MNTLQKIHFGSYQGLVHLDYKEQLDPLIVLAQDVARFYTEHRTSVVDSCLDFDERNANISVLRDHRRSLVLRYTSQDCDWVIKWPRNKNNSKWSRFTTLYRQSEVFRDARSQELLKEWSMPSTQVIMAIEQRQYLMVRDSFVIYEYRKGNAIEECHYPQMMALFKKIHDFGYLHDDPHTRNFLHQDDVFLIDCKPRKNRLAALGIAHNIIKMCERYEQPEKLYRYAPSEYTSSIWFTVAFAVYQCKNTIRSVRRKLKKYFSR